MKGIQKVIVRMPPDLIKKIDGDAEKHYETRAATIRRIVREHFEYKLEKD